MYVIRAAWQLLRPRTLIVIYLHAVIFVLLQSTVLPSLATLICITLSLATWYVHAVAVNDLSDEEVDKINLPLLKEDKDRPLVNKTLSRRGLITLSWLAAAVFLLSSYLIAPHAAVIAIIMLGLNAIYSLPPVRLSARGILAQLSLPLGYVGLPFMLTAAASQRLPDFTGFLMMLGLYAIFTGRLFLKDIRDEKGDRMTGKRTYLVRHGLTPTLIQSSLWIVIGLIMTLYPLAARDGLFLLLAPIVLVGVVYGMYGILHRLQLDDKLLHVGVVGRSLSCWAFCIALYLAMAWTVTAVAVMRVVLLTAVALFFFGLLSQIEAIRLRPGKQQQ